MLFHKRTFVFLSWAVLLSTLTACANSPSAKNLEQSLAADPRLQNNASVLPENQAKSLQPVPNQSSVKLPADFPSDIPIYPNSTLEEVTPSSHPDQGADHPTSTRWQSFDPSNFIASFYRSQFPQKNWQVLQQPTDDVAGSFIAQRHNLRVTVAIQPQTVTKGAPNQPQTSTIVRIDYATPSNNQSNHNSLHIPTPGDPEFIGPVLPNANQPKQLTNNTNNNSQVTPPTPILNTQGFSDLQQVPPQWRQHLQDLTSLGVLSIEPKATNQFLPNKIITRREYARWLVAANNAMYANDQAKQIRLAADSNQATFKDVSPKDADFPAIQGLAEAGLIPSPLSGDATTVLFRPDAPLTREQMLLWKVPLDTRQALPNANLEAVKQTWGFQDTEKIEPKVLRAVLADFQNGEQANIRRVFGYTTLFQPKKTVTRGEAAETLWYFGTQSEGISAAEGLKLKG